MKTKLRFKNFLKVLAICLLFVSPKFGKSQTVSIGGVINTYVHVSDFDTAGCKTRLVVTTTTGFSVGDSVLVIQMKGANFDSTNTSAFGNIINLSGAGNYEIAAITAITSNTIMLNGKLLKSYSLSGRIQLVSIPNYTNANITSSLTCLPWNGLTGGVLIFSVQNNLQFNADIDVTGKGFRGGAISGNPDGSCGSGSPNYYYDVFQPGPSWVSTGGGAEKGEGIGVLSSGKLGGKGKLVNGGGGGSKHNSGGGGGSNFTEGGRGGNEYFICPQGNFGVGGTPLSSSYTNNILFVGGGGGCGDENNGIGTSGEQGGGIVIISAPSITGNNYTVTASGNTVVPVAGANGDGAGGGGAGGTIFIKTNAINTSLTLVANGGAGGNQAATDCVGPGGGGGTGAIFTSMASLGGANVILTPGAAGAFTNGACAQINYGALPGVTNTVGAIFNRNFIYTPTAVTYTARLTDVTQCSLHPVSLTSTVTGDTYFFAGPLVSSNTNTLSISSTSLADTGDYTLTVSSQNGCLSIINTSLTVYPTPTISVLSASICNGSPIIITPTITGAVSYTWSGPNAFSASTPTVNVPVASLATGGVYNLTVTSIESCTASASATIDVAVVNGLTISATSPVCSGAELVLDAGIGSGNLLYQWTGPNGFTSAIKSPTINPVTLADAGSYSLVASVNTCTTSIVSPPVSVESPPTISVNSASVCDGRSVSIVASSTVAGVTYSWTGPNSFSNATSSFSFAIASQSLIGVYNLTVTSPLGCTNTASPSLSVIAAPNLTLTSNEPVCGGTALNFTTSGGQTYTLTGPNNYISTATNPTIINVSTLATGNYTLIGSLATCTNIIMSSVTIKLQPAAAAGTLAPVCAPRSFQLNSSGGVLYSWTGPGGFTSQQQNPSITTSSLANQGNYIVTVEGANGCQSTATTVIAVIITPTIAVVGATVCIGQPAILQSGGALSYTWTGPNSFLANGPNASIPIANNQTAGTYSLFVITLNTCTVSTSTELDLIPLPVPTLTVPSRSCINSVLNFKAAGATLYNWKGPLGIALSGTLASFIPSNIAYSGTYTLIATSARGCTASVTSLIKIDPLPTIILTGKTDGCVPFCADYELKPTGLSTVGSATWTTISDYYAGLVMTRCYNVAGDVAITGSVTDTLGCKNGITFTVRVRPKPEADFSYSPEKPIENLDEVLFINSSTGDKIDSWNWYVNSDDGYKTSGPTMNYLFESEGAYPVALTVKNVFGCVDTVVKAIVIEPALTLYIPNAFTPNGDGKNDIFIPKGSIHGFYQLSIYDRWGQKIFQTNSFEDGWDGTFKGSNCKNDTYVWQIAAENRKGVRKLSGGEVLLIR